MTDPREDKLPKWAQVELRMLRMRLQEAEDRERMNAGEISDPVVFIRPYSDIPHPVARAHEPVLFRIGDSRITIKVSTRERKPVLEVTAYNGRLKITPQASNALYAEVDE